MVDLIQKEYKSAAFLEKYTDSHPIVGHIPSNVLNTFRSAGGPILQLPTAVAMLATLEYLAEKSLSMIGWETGYTNPILCNNSCNQIKSVTFQVLILLNHLEQNTPASTQERKREAESGV